MNKKVVFYFGFNSGFHQPLMRSAFLMALHQPGVLTGLWDERSGKEHVRSRDFP